MSFACLTFGCVAKTLVFFPFSCFDIMPFEIVNNSHRKLRGRGPGAVAFREEREWARSLLNRGVSMTRRLGSVVRKT